MLADLQISDVEELFADIPEGIRLQRLLNIPSGRSEPDVWLRLCQLSDRNRGARATCFAGAGAYDHYIPPVVKHLASRGEFVTSYTPYQPEISQGTLQAIFEFQTVICQLLEMEAANASLYDGSTALAEACLMALNINGGNRITVVGGLHPEYVAVLRTYFAAWEVTLEELPLENGRTPAKVWQEREYNPGAAVVIQQPNFFGQIEDVFTLSEWAHAHGALVIAVVDPLSLGILPPPGAYGADIAVGEGQSLGQPMSFGGPYLGFMATKQDYVRRLPGRIVGQTTDKDGRVGYVLTLQAREQHIRRARATSNICTNQALNALTATIYLCWLGPEGLKEIGELCLEKSHYLAERIQQIPDYVVPPQVFFKEFVVQTPRPAREIIQKALEQNIIAGVDLGRFNPEWDDRLLIAVTEMRTRQEIDRFVDVLEACRP